jgi:nucleoside-diphosphate-sugar epimerase
MQTILGSGGAIGAELAKVLPTYTNQVRLVSRNPSKINPNDEIFAADLTDKQSAIQAVKGSEVAYLVVGLPYDAKIWESTWPLIVENTLEACQVNSCKLVFFDNIYMYHPDSIGNMTEDSEVNPVTRKGRVRAKIARRIMEASARGDLQALIARSADFYGPSVKEVSILTETIFKPLSKGKKAQCLGNMDVKHSFTFTPDAGKATAMLGNAEDTFGEVWHLPTAPNPYTTRELVNLIAAELKVEPRYMSAGKLMVRMMGLFIPIMREMVEMMYQYERDYIFISDKFEKRFDFKTTPYLDGIKQIVETDYKGS